MPPDNGKGLIDISSNHSVDETVERVKGILQAKGITLFALVDHSGEAAKWIMTIKLPRIIRKYVDASTEHDVKSILSWKVLLSLSGNFSTVLAKIFMRSRSRSYDVTSQHASSHRLNAPPRW